MKLTLVELAVLVLRRAVERARSGPVDDESVRLALRCLMPRMQDRQLLFDFWAYAGQLPNANRSDSCDVVVGEIVADLQAGAAYPDGETAARRLLVDRLAAESRQRVSTEAAKRRHYFAPPPRRRPADPGA